MDNESAIAPGPGVTDLTVAGLVFRLFAAAGDLQPAKAPAGQFQRVAACLPWSGPQVVEADFRLAVVAFRALLLN